MGLLRFFKVNLGRKCSECYGVLSFVGSFLGSNGFCLKVCNKWVFGSLLCDNVVLAVCSSRLGCKRDSEG